MFNTFILNFSLTVPSDAQSSEILSTNNTTKIKKNSNRRKLIKKNKACKRGKKGN